MVYGCAPFVPEVEQGTAPILGHDLGCANVLDISYTAWGSFCRRTGLTTMFFDKSGGLFRPHTRIARIDPAHVVELRSAIARYMAKYPKAKPAHDRHYALALMHWLLFWFEWAIAHCQVPAIENA